MKIVVALEDVMVLDDPPVLLAHVGAQDRGSEFRVILRRQHVADIVQQGADNSFGVGSIAQAARRRLQRVSITVNSGSQRIFILEQRKLTEQIVHWKGGGHASELKAILC